MKPDPDFLRRERESYQQETAALRATFERTGNGAAAIRRRSTLVDGIIKRLWKQYISDNPEHPGLTIVSYRWVRPARPLSLFGHRPAVSLRERRYRT